jgi:multiple sugar transport system substrate-binding protein
MVRKKFSMGLVTVVAAVALLSGCSGNNNGKSSTNPNNEAAGEQQQSVTLGVSWWGAQNRHDDTLKVISMYKDQNPGVVIEANFSGYAGYWEKMAAQAAGNNLPDVMNQNFGEYLTQYSDKGLLTDLTPFIESGLIDVSKIDDSILDLGRLNGKLVGIPLGLNGYGTIYDPEMFKQAGVPEPTLGWTWTDVTNAATKMKEVSTYGVHNMEIHNVAEVILRQHGVRLFNKEGNGLGYDDDKIIENLLAMKLSWVKNGLAPTLEVNMQHDTAENKLIVLGELGMEFGWSSGIAGTSESAKRPLKLGPLPSDTAEYGGFLRPGMFFSIPESSKNKEEAAKFINYFINDIEAGKVLRADRGVPVNSDVQAALKSEVDAATLQAFEYVEFLTEHGGPIDKNQPISSTEVLDALKEVDEKVLYEKMTPEEGAKEFRMKAEKILSR